MKNVKLVVALGNPGRGYERTRHNVGQRVLSNLVKRSKLKFRVHKKLNFKHSELMIGNEQLILAETGCFMNVSGEAVWALIKHFNVEGERDILILVDDVHIPLGTLRFRKRGSSGGHNGLKSIINQLGTEEFARLRIGVGKPDTDSRDLKDYVLGRFTKNEELVLSDVLTRACDCILSWAQEPPEKVMNKFN